MGLFDVFKKKKKDSDVDDEMIIREHLKNEPAKKAAAPKAEEKKEPAKKAAAPKAEEKKEPAKKAAAPKAEEKKEPAKKAAAPKVEEKKETEKKAAPKAKDAPKKVEATVTAPIDDEDDDVSEDDEAVTVEENGKPVRNGKFDIKKSKDGRFYFSLYASNKQVIAYSQMYASITSAMNGIKSVIAHAPKATIEDTTLKKPNPQSFPKWEIYIDKAGEFRFRLYASNGSCICHSHGYSTKATCKGGMESIQRFASESAGIDKTYLKK